MEIVSFGEWVQKRRNQLGFTRSALAQSVGCSPATIKKVERDERRPSVQIAALLAKSLQIPKADREDFIRRARGEFVPRFGAPPEMSIEETLGLYTFEDFPRHNLPSQTMSFIGRETELAWIESTLANPNCHLLTILGAGGMGKTRLAIEAAAAQLSNFTDGIAYVSLAPISIDNSTNSVNSLAGAVADALKITFHAGKKPENQLSNYLRRKELLLVLDNFEHLLGTVHFLGELIRNAPDIKILVTSRERLNLQEEWLLQLQGLIFPIDAKTPSQALQFSAVQLFDQRAKQVKASFELNEELPAVLKVCQLVEGMPLGIELAAAWVRQLPCGEIAQKIASELEILSTTLRNVPERHRSIHGVFSYSWRSLSEEEQGNLKKLSVFRGGFERQAAEVVANVSLTLLSSLVDKSFLSVDDQGRYSIHELIRQFVNGQLALSAADVETARDAHCLYFLVLLEEQGSKLKGPEVLEGLTAIEKNFENVRVALQWAVDKHILRLNLGIEYGLFRFLAAKGWFLEAEELFRVITSKQESEISSANSREQQPNEPPLQLLYSNYLIHLAYSRDYLGRLDDALATYEKGLSVIPLQGAYTMWVKGWNLTNTGLAFSKHGDLISGKKYLEKGSSLLKESGDSFSYACSLVPYSQNSHLMGDYEEASRLVAECQQLLEEKKEQLFYTYTLSTSGRLAAEYGALDEAEARHIDCLLQRKKLDYQSAISYTLSDLGTVAYLKGEYEKARGYFQESILLANELNLPYTTSRSLWGLGNLAVAEGDYTLAARFFQESGLTNIRMIGGPGWAALGLNKWKEAEQYFRSCLQIMLEKGNKPLGLDALVGVAHLSAQTGAFMDALELLVLVQLHPASNYEIMRKAKKLWAKLTAELPSENILLAETKGSDINLWAAAEKVLDALRMTS